MDNNELKELHNRLNKLCSNDKFSEELKQVLHKIVDKMWNENDDYVYIQSNEAISKTVYIYEYIKNISKLYIVYEDHKAKKYQLDNGNRKLYNSSYNR